MIKVVINFKLPSFSVASRGLEIGDRLKKHEHSTVLKEIFHETVNVHDVLNVCHRIDIRNLPAILNNSEGRRKMCLETLISKKKALCGLKHYLPKRAAGETDETVQEQIEFLKKEKSILHPD
ncbi:hypothetical protein Avbf_00532 [Armadillidium vulgare]|nr:hypothetical protein Avbf_02751 [Armadillidium vulgare]RXG69778.1 hypothetical protein Avbf_06463 [Armadillidium vulgare]RXG72081.1 hypothetical protein Avbf_00532 [Armadillidium vulgare]